MIWISFGSLISSRWMFGSSGMCSIVFSAASGTSAAPIVPRSCLLGPHHNITYLFIHHVTGGWSKKTHGFSRRAVEFFFKVFCSTYTLVACISLTLRRRTAPRTLFFFASSVANNGQGISRGPEGPEPVGRPPMPLSKYTVFYYNCK